MRTTIIIWVLILIGSGLRFWVGRRRFKRRNAAGLAEFSSYGQALFLTAVERLLMIVANLLIISGCFLALLYW